MYIIQCKFSVQIHWFWYSYAYSSWYLPEKWLWNSCGPIMENLVFYSGWEQDSLNSDNPQHMPLERLAPFPPSILWQHVTFLKRWGTSSCQATGCSFRYHSKLKHLPMFFENMRFAKLKNTGILQLQGTQSACQRLEVGGHCRVDCKCLRRQLIESKFLEIYIYMYWLSYQSCSDIYIYIMYIYM